MKIMIDTNILISAALFPNGTAAKAFQKSLMQPFEPVVCDYIIDELRRKFHEKFADRTAALKTFLETASPAIRIVAVPSKPLAHAKRIRDAKDRPILRAALTANVDFLLTGDKDFLEASIEKPKIVSAAEFLSMS